jgi:exodeoxyribonuclease V beta subunit
LSAGDVAVLVRTNVQARTIKAALDEAGVPAVVNGAGSVFATDAARDWLALLEALERPEYLPRARAAALTAFLAWPAERVAGAADEDWDALQQRLHAWAGLLRRTGVATLMEAVTQAERLPERLLGRRGGERTLTDLRHVGELLHGAAIDGRLGVTAVATWLRQRMAGDDREAGAEDRARRLESDAAAVQVLTVHRSKGLEFGVVYCGIPSAVATTACRRSTTTPSTAMRARSTCRWTRTTSRTSPTRSRRRPSRPARSCGWPTSP